MGEALLEQVINGLMMGSIYVLVALGMVLIYGVMHVVNFAHGVLFTLGGYLGHFFYYRVAESYLLAIVLAVMSLAIIGVLLERGVFRPLSGNLRNQVIASLGLILFLENLVVALWGASALQWKVASADRLVQIGDLRFSQHHLGIIVITMVLVTALGLFLKYTRFGTAIRATSQSQEAAVVVGIPVRRVQWSTFAIGCMLAGVGGAMVGPLFLVFPQMGDVPLIKGLAGILLGGMGSVPGAVVGGMVLGLTEAISTLYLPTDYRDSIAFMVMVLILLVRPQGLFGQRMRGED
ncbi:MAG: branched-chain amino acid ABC transporter permease [Comamonadaceae bacterium]|jgi:branched-chain amino acid transport system permease protein|nr:branched-chain amino acid ABC transporter permease [Comamonadaceae bacterium]